MKKYIDSIYAENMWINERQYELLLRRAEEDSLDKEAIDTIVKNAADSAISNYKKVFKRMGNKKYYYKLDKCIYEVGREENVIFKCKYKFQRLAGNFKIVISPVYNYKYHADGFYKPWTKVISAEDNQLVIQYTFNHEDMYIVTIFYVLDEEEMLLYSSNVYALEKDLFNLNFYKADLHMHTPYLKEGKCVAVEISGKNIMCYGDFRYVKLAQFLVDNYFPERDEFAYIEAKKVEERILNK